MMKLYIEHNPFSVQTTFKVDGGKPDDKAFSEFETKRFQEWIYKFFDYLKDDNNGLGKYSVEFKGVEDDYLDLVEAANFAKEAGMDIQLSYIPAENANERLVKIQNLVIEAQSHPLFKEQMQSNSDIIKGVRESFNRDFDVYVTATMSSGKSTLINAMLGSELLPAANEATTATIAKIYDTDKPVGEYLGQRFNVEGYPDDPVDPVQPINLETLQEWNKKKDTFVIEIEGNIYGVKKRDEVRLVLSDTPGPNNSQTEEHLKTTMEYIKDTVRNPMILYILNATQLGINDDKNTLKMISEIIQNGGKQSQDRFIFVVNKMDVFDPEKGENPERVLENVKRYLINNGIKNPNVYPVSANLTRLLRKRDIGKESLTRSEKGELFKMEDLFVEEPVMDLTKYMNLTNTVQRKLDEGGYSVAEYRSGLPAVEKVIDTYIEKYNLPERVLRAYRALNSAIAICSNEAELVKSLALSEDELKKLRSAIDKLREIKSNSANTGKYIKTLRQKGIGLPKEIIQQTNSIERKVTRELREHSEAFTGRVEKGTAKRKLNNLKQDIEFISRDLQVTFDGMFQQIDELTGKELSEEYQRRLKAIFDDVANFKLPQLDRLRDKMNFNFDLSLNSDDIQEEEVFSHYEKEKSGTERVRVGTERVKTGTKRVKVGERSTSSWWNPFSWGDTENIYEDRDVFEERDVYENRDVYVDKAVYKTVEYVDLDEVWEERGSQLQIWFNGLTSKATQEIEAYHQKLVEEYIQFMEKEFNPRFEGMLRELESKIQDQASLEKDIEQAKVNLNEIEAFKQRLDQVMVL